MNPTIITNIVKEIAVYENLKPADVAHMQRYFLRLYTPMMQREVADMLCCERSTICNSVKKMKRKEFAGVVQKIKSMLNNRERGYTWMKRN